MTGLSPLLVATHGCAFALGFLLCVVFELRRALEGEDEAP